MKKLIISGAVAPLLITGCFGGGSASEDRSTTLGVDSTYIEVDGQKFTQDTFYQMAKQSGWQKVKTWFDQKITKHVSTNLETAGTTGGKGYDSIVKNALNQFELFHADATNNGTGQICDGVAVDTFCYEKAEQVISQELMWEDFQNYKVRQVDTTNYSYALNIQRLGYSVTNANAEPNNINSATFEADARAWLNANFQDYMEKEIRQGAVDRLFTMNYLLSLETLSTYIDGGNVTSRPTSRLNSAYSDNLPTIWTVYKFEYEKISAARADINVALTQKTDGPGAITTAKDTALKAVPGFHSKYSGIGNKSDTFGSSTATVGIVNSSKDEFRKTGFVDYETEDDDFDFIDKPNEADDYYYVYHIEPIKLAVDSTDKTLVKQPAHKVDATSLNATERLYAYYGLGSIQSLSTFATEFYYGEFMLESFDIDIYNFMKASMDN